MKKREKKRTRNGDREEEKIKKKTIMGMIGGDKRKQN